MGGWHDGAYVFPDGTIVGDPEGLLIYEPTGGYPDVAQTGGSLEGWGRLVAAPAVHSPYLVSASRPRSGACCSSPWAWT